MKEGVGRLLLTSELTTDAADRRTAFLIDAEHALTAWHCARDSREGADPLWLRLPRPGVDGAWVDLPMRVADHDTTLDASVLRLDPGRSVQRGDGIDLPRWLAGVALVLGTEAVAHARVRTEGFPRRAAPAGLSFSGTVTDPTARLRSGATVLQLHLDELGAGVPQGPGGHSGGPVLCTEASSGGEVVVGLVRAFPADESGELAVGGTVLATRIQDLAARFPLVSDVIARRARNTLSATSTGHSGGVGVSLATLVRADAPHPTRFLGRVGELRRLHDWCAAEDERSCWLITGPGGQGKTRLARHLCDQLNATGGWIAAPIHGAGDERELAIGLALAAQTGRAVLLAVDYAAEYGAVQLRKLLDRLRTSCPAPLRWRLLLLARHTGDWWDGDSTSLAPQLRAAGVDVQPRPLELPALVAQAGDREEVFRDLVEQLRDPVTRFAANHNLTVRDTPARPPLYRPEYGSALLLHVAAVCALLPEAGPGGEPAEPLDPSKVIDRLLDLERDYHWLYQDADQTLYPATGEAFGDLARGRAGRQRLETLVAAAALTGAATHYEAQQLVTTALGATERAEEIALWLHDLYPPPTDTTTGYLHPLQPDLLGEELIVRVLDRERDAGTPTHRQLPHILIDAGTEKQIQRLLTVLIRAGERHPHIAELLAGTPHHHNDTPTLLTRIPTGLDLTTVEGALPRYNTHLLLASVAITQYQLTNLGDPHPTSPADVVAQRAHTLTNLAVRLAEAGRRGEGLTTAQEAVTLRRELVALNRDAYLPDLATSVNNLAIRLAEAGRRGEGLTAAQEAVTLYRELVALNRDAYLPNLATSVNNLAIRLAEAGRRGEGLTAAQEAVTLYRELVALNRDAYLPNLATSVNNLAIRLAEAGRRGEGLTAAQEAVTLRRELVTLNRDAYLPNLATSVNNLAIRLAEAGRRGEGLTAAQEAVTLRRELVTLNRDAYLPDLAMSVNNLAVYLAEAGRREEALFLAREACTHYHDLARTDPDVFGPEAETADALVAALREKESGTKWWRRRRAPG